MFKGIIFARILKFQYSQKSYYSFISFIQQYITKTDTVEKTEKKFVDNKVKTYYQAKEKEKNRKKIARALLISFRR